MIWNETTLKLKGILVKLYTAAPSYLVVVRESGLLEENIKFNGRAIEDWSEILVEAHKHQKILDIIARAKKEYPENIDLKQAADEYILQNTALQRDSRSASKALPSDITTVYGNYLEILQIKREIASWAVILANTDHTSTNQENLPLIKNISRMQQSLQQLSNLTREEYGLLEKDNNLRDFFGQSRYDLMKTLSRIGNRSDNLAAKLSIFTSIFSPQSIVALKWQQEIQQLIKNVLQDLQEIDKLVRPLQTQSSSNEDIRHVVLAHEHHRSSHIIDLNQKTQLASLEDNVLPANRCISLCKDEEKLRERIFNLYKIEDLIDLFYNLSCAFGDPSLEYENLSGNNAKDKIAMLFQRIRDQGLYQKLEEHLVKIPGFMDRSL